MAKNKKRTSKRKTNRVVQFLEYNLAGLAFFWTGYAVLLLMDYFGAPLWLSSTVSYTVGLTVNFLLERYWVFGDSKDGSAFAVATERYIVLSLVNLILNYVILKTLEVVGVPLAISPFISSVLFTPWNWLWYKYYVFAETKVPVKKKKK